MLPADETPADLPERAWRHKSVLALLAHHAPAKDPVALIRRLARELVSKAKAVRWGGPPFQPGELASFLDIQVEPAEADIRADARLFPAADGRLHLEYNSANSPQRIRFSICHEIIHTFFPDCYETVQHRDPERDFDPIHAEFEMLCNIGAAELLMPWEDFGTRLSDRWVDIPLIQSLREGFDVSIEACLIRIADLSHRPCAVVFFEGAYTKKERQLGAGTVMELDLGIAKSTPKLRVQYYRPSSTWTTRIPKGKAIPIADSAVHRCVGLNGFVETRELWEFLGSRVRVVATELPFVAGREYANVVAYIERCR